MTPETQYARSGDVNIAYQVVGEGPLDLVYVPGWVSNVELIWDEPAMARFLERLASALFGHSEGGNMCVLFAATYPERTSALVTLGSFARRRDPDDDYPWAPTAENREETAQDIERNWGHLRPEDVEYYAPSRLGDDQFVRNLERYLRRSASPGAAAALLRMNSYIDVRDVLPTIRVPTLVLHRTGDHDVDVAEGRYLASKIPGARFVELPGDDHWISAGNPDEIADEIESFLTGTRPAEELDRVLATVLFTDIVDSTKRAVELGDRRWRQLLNTHDAAVRRELERFRGREVDTAGDGFFATFDGPARAVRCAISIGDAVRELGLDLRAGIHTGECELDGSKVRGIAVHTGARVASLAAPGEVLVSRTVKDLVAGSGLDFVDRGVHELKGVPGEWRLYAAV